MKTVSVECGHNDTLSTITGTIYIVLHGDKETGANPELTKLGNEQMKDLAPAVPNSPPVVISGTGKRNIQCAAHLGLKITHYSPVAGRPSSLQPDRKNIILPDGAKIERSELLTTGIPEAIVALFRSCPPQTVILAGSPILRWLKLKNVDSPGVYTLENGTFTKIALPDPGLIKIVP